MKRVRFYASPADFRQRNRSRFHLHLICSNPQLLNKSSYGLEDLSIDVFLSSTRHLELALRYAQGMIATFDHVQDVWRLHLGSNALQKIQRTERVTRALDKQDRRS